MEDTPLSELPVAVYVSRKSTQIMSTLGTSPAASSTTVSFCRTNDPIFGLTSEIDEGIATEYALDIKGGGGDSDVKGDEFELYINTNETEYSI